MGDNEVRFLSDKEIEEFLNEIDHNNDGYIAFDELEKKLDDIHKEIAPNPLPHHLHHDDRDEKERHAFFRSIMGTDKNRIPKSEFAEIVKTWKVPSKEQDKKQEDADKKYLASLPWTRKARAFWSVNGPEVLFLSVVLAMMIAMGTWQLVKYLQGPLYRPAFGWGTVLAKTCAGILYPTWFFLVLSMSRYFSTAMRKFYHVSRFINWDLGQSFHIKISCVALFFSTLHAISHLTGTFVFGSQVQRQSAVDAALGPYDGDRSYRYFIETRPGWTGLVALGLFYLLAGLSMPAVRNWSYEIFQLGHLLMFPILGLLCAHGTAQLLQFAMLGYWLAFPTLLVIIERCWRIARGFVRIPAELKILDDETIVINIIIPERRIWPFKAGQYILLQVPEISHFEWHPFTISTCVGNEMQVHINTSGDWTTKVRKLGADLKYVGVDGPFGAPAQRFYDYDQSMVLGSGIGITPFSAILKDLEVREGRASRSHSRAPSTRTPSRAASAHRDHVSNSIRQPLSSASSQTATNEATPDSTTASDGTQYLSEKRRRSISGFNNRGRSQKPKHCRRVDFHWIVKDRNYLLWFSDLLNSLARTDKDNLAPHHTPCLDLRLTTHVTQKRKSISTHVFRWLLEMHRTEEHPTSPLTGLINPTHFGRPDLSRIMEQHYESMLQTIREQAEKGEQRRKTKVGVFFCGTPIIGYELADRCQLLSFRGRDDGSGLEYHFHMEVFN